MSCDTNQLFRSDEELLSYQCDVNEIFYHNKNHYVLFELPLSSDFKPHQSPDIWDSEHVRMPFSNECKYVEICDDNRKSIKLRWDLIRNSLQKQFKSSFEIVESIKSYNSRYESIWLFDGFHTYVNRDLNEAQRKKFLQVTIPKIVDLALRLPMLIQCPIPLLKKGMNTSISMTQEQAASILANAFLSTFPRRNTTKKNSEYTNYPGINFHKLFNGKSDNVIEKIKCIINYFERVTTNMPKGNLTFTRQSIATNQFPNWKEEEKTIFQNIKYAITSKYKIEDAPQMLQVDFANKAIGGGVIGNGCVQEEIRFCINPELIVARLFTECLDDNESFFIIGSEQFSAYTGYSSNFKFLGDFVDFTPSDQYQRKKTRIVAIDALSYTSLKEQFKVSNLIRELNKAYAGFYYPSSTYQVIATGFWGCGAFGGHPIKSALIQLMACRMTRKSILFSTHGNVELESAINNLFKFLVHNSVSVSQLFYILKLFYSSASDDHPCYLISFIEEQVRQNNKSYSQTSNSSRTLSINTFYDSNEDTKSLRPKIFMNDQAQLLKKSNTQAKITKTSYVQPLAKSSKSPGIQSMTTVDNSNESKRSPNSKPFPYLRFNDVPHTTASDKRKFEDIKNQFVGLPKDENSDNNPKDGDKKANKSALLDALNDYF